jgi:hypothetical protein
VLLLIGERLVELETGKIKRNVDLSKWLLFNAKSFFSYAMVKTS